MTSESLKKLKECHPDLIKIIMRVDEHYPVQVICGHRSNEDQLKVYQEGKSLKKPGTSKHNLKPSLAVDLVPDPDRNPKTLAWADFKEFEIMCLTIEAAADELNIKIRLGRDFKKYNKKGQLVPMADWPHIELVS
jgi:peptidoglycan L-alanyl-D-glutamate endopeptidase CwlK